MHAELALAGFISSAACVLSQAQQRSAQLMVAPSRSAQCYEIQDPSRVGGMPTIQRLCHGPWVCY